MAKRLDNARVVGVILAAGTSSRLGQPKQLLTIDGEPIVKRVARAALAAQLAHVIVVVGHAADQIGPWLDDLDIGIALNPDFEAGQASSLRRGIRAIPADADAVLFLLGDQPTLETAAIDSVINAYRQGGCPIVQARYRDRPGHPVLFDRGLFPELMAVAGDLGARDVIRDHAAGVRFVDIDTDAPPDIDTDADYRQLLELLEEDQAK